MIDKEEPERNILRKNFWIFQTPHSIDKSPVDTQRVLELIVPRSNAKEGSNTTKQKKSKQTPPSPKKPHTDGLFKLTLFI